MLFGKYTDIKSNTAEIRKYLPNVNTTFDFEKLRYFIKSSYERYLQQILGDELSEALIVFYTTGVLPDDNSGSGSGSSSASGSGGSSPERTAWNNLLEKCQYALANLSFYHGFHLINVKIGDSGAFINTDEKKRDLYKYEEDSIKNSLKTEGYNYIDVILAYLENNIRYFAEWISSASYSALNKYFVRNASEFNEIFAQIGNSRLVYLSLIPYIDYTESFYIQNEIGAAYFSELQTQFAANTLTADNELIVIMIKKAVCFLSIFEGIDTLGINITDKAVYFENIKSIQYTSKETTTVSIEMLNQIKSKAFEKGNNYINNIKETLNSSTTSQYLTYKASTAYNDGDNSRTFNNTDKKITRL